MPMATPAAAGLGALRLPPHLLAALIPIAVLIAALDLFCIVSLIRAPSVRHMPKLVWAVVILFVSAPLGALGYLFWGRERAGQVQRGTPPTAAAQPVTSPAAAAQPVTPPAAAAQPVTPPAAAAQPVTPRAAAAPAASPTQDRRLAQASQDTAAVPPAETPAGGLIVSTAGLTRDYGGTGLFDVDLRVPAGSVYGLVGPNGAGKTTLLSILSGIRRSDRGMVSWTIPRSQVAVCPDVPEFDPWLTAAEAASLATALVAPGRAADVAGALRAAGLAESAERRIGAFSRGMLQRVGLACALVSEPQLLILDEPTSALDPAGRAEMLGLLAAMRGQRSVIFSSHILADVQRIADQVGILRDGRLLYQGPTQDLIDTYLRPAWLVRLAGDVTQVRSLIASQQWAIGTEQVAADAIRVDAITMEAGERGIPAAIAACGARQVSCEPVAADLESAFLALTSVVPA